MNQTMKIALMMFFALIVSILVLGFHKSGETRSSAVGNIGSSTSKSTETTHKIEEKIQLGL